MTNVSVTASQRQAARIAGLAYVFGILYVPVYVLTSGGLTVAGEALRPIIEGGYGVYGVLLLVWRGAVGWRLYGLGADSGGRAARTEARGTCPQARASGGGQ
jgi:hypothetical protein